MNATQTATIPCFGGCGTQIEKAPGNYYCPECVAQQTREQGDEREAFDAYHKWVDRVSAAAR